MNTNTTTNTNTAETTQIKYSEFLQLVKAEMESIPWSDKIHLCNVIQFTAGYGAWHEYKNRAKKYISDILKAEPHKSFCFVVMLSYYYPEELPTATYSEQHRYRTRGFQLYMINRMIGEAIAEGN